MRLRLLVSLTHVVALEVDYWLTGRLDEIEGKEKRRSTARPVDASHNLRLTVLVLTSMWLHLFSGVVIPVPL